MVDRTQLTAGDEIRQVSHSSHPRQCQMTIQDICKKCDPKISYSSNLSFKYKSIRQILNTQTQRIQLFLKIQFAISPGNQEGIRSSLGNEEAYSK